MGKLIASLLLLLAVTNIYAKNNNQGNLKVKLITGDYIAVNVNCTGIEEECIGAMSSNEVVRIKSIAKLKSYKSWARLMNLGKLDIIAVEYRNNKKVLTLIICHSSGYDYKSNNFGREILNSKGGK